MVCWLTCGADYVFLRENDEVWLQYEYIGRNWRPLYKCRAMLHLTRHPIYFARGGLQLGSEPWIVFRSLRSDTKILSIFAHFSSKILRKHWVSPFSFGSIAQLYFALFWTGRSSWTVTQFFSLYCPRFVGEVCSQLTMQLLPTPSTLISRLTTKHSYLYIQNQSHQNWRPEPQQTVDRVSGSGCKPSCAEPGSCWSATITRHTDAALPTSTRIQKPLPDRLFEKRLQACYICTQFVCRLCMTLAALYKLTKMLYSV